MKFSKKRFPKASSTLSDIKKKALRVPFSQRFFLISESIFHLINGVKTPCFLLPAVLSFLDDLNAILSEPYRLSSFEFWLNHFSSLSWEENRKVRGKIMGKFLPRDAYQNFFPTGKKEGLFGSHVVTGHTNPDPDALVASLIGWMDAFACRVGRGLHHWHLPGGAPESPVTLLLESFFSGVSCSLFSRSSLSLRLFARDLVSRDSVYFATGEIPLSTLRHNVSSRAIVAVDGARRWVGDWTQQDVEPVGQILALVNTFFRSIEIWLLESLLALFKQKHLTQADAKEQIKKLWQTTVWKKDRLSLTEHQIEWLDQFLIKIFGVQKGLKSGLHELALGLSSLGLNAFSTLEKKLTALDSRDLFDGKSLLTSERHPFFKFLESLFKKLGEATSEIGAFLDRLDSGLLVKKEILGISSPILTMFSDPETIKQKMSQRDFLTVAIPTKNNRDAPPYPLGVVFTDALQRPFYGSVTLRDFCNRDEVDISPYLEIVSVVDHHKTSLKTDVPPVAMIGDVQSSNTLVGEEELAINEAARGLPSPYFVHPERVYMECFFILQAIVDDTDMLTKVTYRDLLCIEKLLSRLADLNKKKLSFSLQDLKGDTHFVEKAASRLLGSKEMGGFLKEITQLKKKLLEENLWKTKGGESPALFGDTKIQNQAVYVSQIKLFPSLCALFSELQPYIARTWLNLIESYAKKNPKVSFYILMVSTLLTSPKTSMEKEMSSQKEGFDEWWMWVSSEEASGLLERFLTSFFTSQEDVNQGETHLKFQLIAGSSLLSKLDLFRWPFVEGISDEKTEGGMVVLRFPRGSLNSRKTALSPYLPLPSTSTG